MSGDSVAERMDAYFQEQADRPFGATELVSGRTLAPFSRAAMAAADNLLAKADRALSVGDPERADLFIGRAVALKYDAHEETAPAASAATMLLFNAVTDELERSPAGDTRWLDAAIDALSSASGWGLSEMRHVLVDIRQDYAIGRGERRTIDRVLEAVPQQIALGDAELIDAALVDAVTSVLEVLHAYRAAILTR